MNAIEHLAAMESNIQQLSKKIRHVSPDAASQLDKALQHVLEAECLLDIDLQSIND